MGSLFDKSSYQDHKYVIQDTGSYGFGAKYSYAEMIGEPNVPFKFKAIIEHYIMKDTDPSTTLESHLYYLEPDSFSASTYKELKARVKVGMDIVKKSIFTGKHKCVYKEMIMSVEEFTDMEPALKRSKNVFIHELIISKLALMSFSV